jgi:protein-tyrosine phosphatase|mmetsp:Transcript_16792/g.30399  ORF Transcript_16792/g.30399 Transcript_16792/m.30399 type:complete len:119 (-) Transcript_16792:66-422(-)
MDTLWLLQHDIRHVLTVAAHTKIENKHQNIQYLQIHVDDDPTEDLRRYWDTAFDFIDQSDNNVLVHCVSGISRSGASDSYCLRYEKAGTKLSRRPRAGSTKATPSLAEWWLSTTIETM